MWSNLLSSGEAAKERFTSAIKETNDALSQRASAHAQQIKLSQKSHSPTSTTTTTTATASTTGTTPTTSIATSTTPTIANDKNDAEDVDKNATAMKEDTPNVQSVASAASLLFNKQPQNELFDSLKLGWGSVVEATKNVVETTRDVVEKEQTRIQASLFSKGPYVRDISLPLDSESLRDAEVVYLTDRLITMSHPAMQSPKNGDITPNRKLAAISHLLQKRHGGKFMIWNLSELEYDYSLLNDQVMTFNFPGSPSPPLGLMLKILLSIESWLKADGENVAVVHCLTGLGRTSTVFAMFLCWMGEAGFDDHDPNKALEYIANCKRISPEKLTIPSQRRYVSYFKNMMDSVRPSQPPILLKRIIMSEAPKFGRTIVEHDQNETNENDSTRDDDQHDEDGMGCSPYLQVFKAGKAVLTTAASKSFNQSKDDLPFCLPSEGSITFPIETIIQGDILIRCRHLSRKGQRISMFRAAFHTGYTPAKVLRLSKAQLDGACNDKRFSDDFFIDLIFEECSAAMASKHLLSSPDTEHEEEKHVKFNPSNTTKPQENTHNEAAARRMGGTIVGSDSNTSTNSASAFDSMLHRDSRFWDVIGDRRRKIATASSSDEADKAQDNVPFYGPTIGRRRDFNDEVSSEKSSDEATYKSNDAPSHRSIQSFSIGGELDFSANEVQKVDDKDNQNQNSPEPTKAKKDDLMDALMAIDDDLDEVHVGEHVDDDDDDDTQTEEIIFDTNSVQSSDIGSASNQSTVDDHQNTNEVSSNVDSVDLKDQLEEQEDSSNEEEQNKSCTSSVVKVDEVDLMGSDSCEFDFDDDDSLQDLEDFLTKAKT